MGMIENFERMIRDGKDSALLRFGLGQEYLRAGAHAIAIQHLKQAVVQDPAYSAAWKLLGKACEAAGEVEVARQAWQQGMAAAEARGDMQAMKEMQVFLRRLENRAASPGVEAPSTNRGQG